MIFEGIFNEIFIYMAIILVAALSGLFSERAGIINIAINGMMVFGALFFNIFGSIFSNGGSSQIWTIAPAAIIAVVLTSGLALLHGLATIVFKVDHVISGTAFNLLAAGISLFMVSELAPVLSLSGSNSFDRAYTILTIEGTSFSPMNIALLSLSVLISISMFIYFRYTKKGLRHISVGENPNASDSASVNVSAYKWWAVLVSGGLAGLAGFMISFWLPVFSGNVQGTGFIALAILIFGQWRVGFIVIASFIFSFLRAFFNIYTEINIPSNILNTLPFVLSLLSLVFFSRFESSPKASGQHFDRARR